MAFVAIRRRSPDLAEVEVQLRFIELTYGKSLAEEVRRRKAEKGRETGEEGAREEDGR